MVGLEFVQNWYKNVRKRDSVGRQAWNRRGLWGGSSLHFARHDGRGGNQMKTKTTNLNPDGCPEKPCPVRLLVAMLGLLLLMVGQIGAFAGQQPLEIPLNPGTAPVTIPNENPALSYKGFAIDGNLLANSPDAGIGDWVIGSPGDGGYVLTPTGVPLVGVTTFARKDLYDSAVDDVFSGSKFNENPADWKWVTSPTSDKTDINNALVHIARDAKGHIWGIIAGDRLSVNGSAYLDVEFLQKPVTNVAGGTFITGGLNNGRTTNDFVLSFNFNGGGSKPALTLWKWQAVGTSYDYVDITSSITNDPKITVYGADNTNTVTVPFLAFGQGTYPSALQFVEAAVDLTALVLDFGNSGQPCDSALGISTIFIKTKSSPAPDAELKDLVDPIQLKLILGASADAGADQKKCPGPTKTPFTVPGTAQPGFSDIASLAWSVVSPSDGSVHIVSGGQCLGGG